MSRINRSRPVYGSASLSAEALEGHSAHFSSLKTKDILQKTITTAVAL